MNRPERRWTYPLALLASLALTLTACGGTGESESSGGEPPATTQTDGEQPSGTDTSDTETSPPTANPEADGLGTAVVTVGDRQFEFTLDAARIGLVEIGACGYLENGFLVTGGSDSNGFNLDILVGPEGWEDPDPAVFGFQKPRVVITDEANQLVWYAGGLADGDIPHVLPEHSTIEMTSRTENTGSGTAVFIEADGELTRFYEWSATQDQPPLEPETMSGTWKFQCP